MPIYGLTHIVRYPMDTDVPIDYKLLFLPISQFNIRIKNRTAARPELDAESLQGNQAETHETHGCD